MQSYGDDDTAEAMVEAHVEAVQMAAMRMGDLQDAVRDARLALAEAESLELKAKTRHEALQGALEAARADMVAAKLATTEAKSEVEAKARCAKDAAEAFDEKLGAIKNADVLRALGLS